MGYILSGFVGLFLLKDMQTPPLRSDPIKKWLWMVRNVLNRTEKIIKKFSKLVLLSNEPISNLPCKFQKFKKKDNDDNFEIFENF